MSNSFVLPAAALAALALGCADGPSPTAPAGPSASPSPTATPGFDERRAHRRALLLLTNPDANRSLTLGLISSSVSCPSAAALARRSSTATPRIKWWRQQPGRRTSSTACTGARSCCTEGAPQDVCDLAGAPVLARGQGTLPPRSRESHRPRGTERAEADRGLNAVGEPPGGEARTGRDHAGRPG